MKSVCFSTTEQEHAPGADNLNMGLPETVPTATNSFVIFAVLSLLILGGIAFAEFMHQRREAERSRKDGGKRRANRVYKK